MRVTVDVSTLIFRQLLAVYLEDHGTPSALIARIQQGTADAAACMDERRPEDAKFLRMWLAFLERFYGETRAMEDAFYLPRVTGATSDLMEPVEKEGK